jgi:hypothetical protein
VTVRPAHPGDMTDLNRVPAGMPTVGQFAASAKAEATVDLTTVRSYSERVADTVAPSPDCGTPIPSPQSVQQSGSCTPT